MVGQLPVWAVTCKRIREKRKMTVSELAEKADVAEETVRRIEDGQPPNLRIISKLADALHIKMAELFV